MPNYDGTGPRGLGRRMGRGRGKCRRDSGGKGTVTPVRAGGRFSDILWLVREAIAIWGAVKALRGVKSGPSLSVSDCGLPEQENKRRLQTPAGPQKNGKCWRRMPVPVSLNTGKHLPPA